MADFKLHSVNWQDGMLVSQQHLRDQDRYVDELIRWYAVIPGDNYGLIRKSQSGKPALSLNLSVSGRELTVEVDRCQAITPGGHNIEITESFQGRVRTAAEVADGTVPVYIGVDTSSKGQVGEPDPTDETPRVPYLVSNYVVTLGKMPALPEEQVIQVALLDVSGAEIDYNLDYYPPCVTLYSDERLNRKVSDYRNRLEKLISLSSQAYMTVAADTVLASQRTALQTAFKQTIGQFVHHLASSYDELVSGKNSTHPQFLIIFFKRLFRVFSTLLNLHPDLKDYLNEKYFMKESSSEIGRYMAAIDDFLMSEYNHRELGIHLVTIDGLFSTLREILGFFAQVKKDQLGEQAVATETLTYRGITYKLADYSSCRMERVGELNYLLIEIADPGPMSDLVVLMAKDLVGTDVWSNMQVRLGLNEARGLGETDPMPVDLNTFGNKVALHAQDMVKSPQVRQVTLVLRGAGDAEALAQLTRSDLIVYSM
ncbi:MAG: hypothetical protein JSU65_12895 [Candidatus Zixiibacteriota bacterium]|nr:MAG: hypothetical protein JSU65_12895 [candidate division Zixibacteria bacterium]